ncbi:MAG: indolepyruvate oxidoreductase subunit beta [Candidatus Cryosericum sp.]|nr:indolepyruvate oxidoreductase subunit beta [bacterium]
MKNYCVYIAGVGGQGVVRTSVIIGLACVKKGVGIVMSEIHGMAQRGGSVPAEMKIGDAYSPIIEQGGTDLLISFEPAESLRAMNKLSKDTVAVVNTRPIVPVTVALGTSMYLDPQAYIDELKTKLKKVVVLDAESIALEAGNVLSLNMVMLGAAAATPGFPLEKEFLVAAMKDNLPARAMDANLRAFDMGFQQATKDLQ